MATIETRHQQMLAELTELRSRQRMGDGLHPGGGGGTSGGVTDDWKASVDQQLQQLHGDVRHLLYGLIGGFLVIGGMIGGLYVRGDAKFERVAERIADVDARQQRLEGKLDLLIERSRPK